MIEEYLTFPFSIKINKFKAAILFMDLIIKLHQHYTNSVGTGSALILHE